MEQVTWRILIAISIPLYALATNNQAQAQISSDGTLSTQVSQSGNIFEITGGVQADRNLFHSFKEFSVHFGSEVFFKNNTNTNIISNIISRVTGGSPSNIDGLIRENYGANFILINPSGINFGANAQLQIGGSFLASTASSLKFADGKEFSAIAPQSSSSLTVSVPVGLQFGQNPAAIRVQGSGHSLTVRDPIFSPITRNSKATGLQVPSGQTLALVGGDLILEGGTLTAEGGRIELGSVAQGLVNLQTLPQGWTLSYESVPNFQNIELRSRALVDASGASGGSIRVQGRNLSVQDGSLVLIQNQGIQPAGAIKVNASEFVTVSGTNADGTIRSSLTNETVGAGRGGDLVISSRQLTVGDGATIVAKTFSPATGGNVHINASESVQVTGASPINPSVTSSIVAASFGPGDSGHNEVSTGRLLTREGGTVAAATFGRGKGGNLTIKATDSVEIVGGEPNSLLPSGAIASTFNAGDAGNLSIDTPRLFVRDGGGVIASTLASGSAGNVIINAPELVEVKGTAPGSAVPSLIASSANLVNPSFQQIFGLPPLPSGASGNVTINAGQLSVTDGALITARNDGSGISGNIRVSAGSILLDNEGAITAELGGTTGLGRVTFFSPVTVGGSQGGGIEISTQQLVVRDGAAISTATFTNASGGSITINASESVQVSGFSPVNPRLLSFIAPSTFGSGDAGNLTVSTGRLIVSDGARLAAGTFGSGSGGNLIVNATQSVEVIGAEPSQSAQSLVGVSTLGAGKAGNLTIDAPRLVVRDGGRIDSSTAATGAAGNITINAPESVEVRGTVPGTRTPSLVSSGANIENEITRQIFNLPPVPSGASGDVTINTSRLIVADGAQVSARNQGAGNAGTLNIKARSLLLDNQGSLTAATQSGEGGNINLQVEDSLEMRRNSQISAEAGGTGNGGNITINANALVLLESSDIIANAIRGRGGNIEIDTQGLFRCEDCQISASSNLGLDGVVEISTLDPDTSLEVLDVPEQLAKPEDVVALACSATQGQAKNEFTITGRGGLPPRPSEALSSEALVSFESPEPSAGSPSHSGGTPEEPEASDLPPPAQGWYVSDRGTVVLATQVPTATPHDSGLTSANCHAH
jgi:filamentous hemagglutinin family protein